MAAALVEQQQGQTHLGPKKEDKQHRLDTLATLKPKVFDPIYSTKRPEIFPWADFTTLPDKNILPLSEYLERITILFLQACNTRQENVLQTIVDKYVAPTFLVNKSETFQSLSREAYIRGKLALWKDSPLFLVHPRLTTAFVEDAKTKGSALVFSTNSIVGTVDRWPELTREEVTVNFFERRKNGEWICTKFETIRGPGHWTFEVGHHD